MKSYDTSKSVNVSDGSCRQRQLFFYRVKSLQQLQQRASASSATRLDSFPDYFFNNKPKVGNT